MHLYDISSEEVAMALKEPGQTNPGSEGRWHAWKPRKEGGWLRVTFKDEGRQRVIITITPKRKFKGGTSYAY